MRHSTTRPAVRSLLGIALWALALPALAVPERVIDLEGTANTRDIGGYPTTDGRVVEYGQILRSDKLSRLTADDFAKLEALGVKTVIDLRTQREHDHDPTVWRGEHPPRFIHLPIGDAGDPWYRKQNRMVKSNRFSAAQSTDQMIDGYRMIADVGVPSYRQLMDIVLDPDNHPVLIHCNAGKDRSGVAVALILEALGVDREVIMDEYLLTNEIARTTRKAELMAKSQRDKSIGRSLRPPSAEAWFPLIGVDEEMLESYWAHIDEGYGSMDAYLAELGVGSSERDLLVAELTVGGPEFAAAGSGSEDGRGQP
jgi:protein-tyrosine phosphatase